jgi:hypothetical protein
MSWTKVGDIQPLYNHTTVVAGDLEVMTGWPGAEAAGYPDEEYELPAGNVMLFDLNLSRPTVFTDGTRIRLLASPAGKGTANVDDVVLAAALEGQGADSVWGTFEVEHGAMVLSCSDCATPRQGAGADDPNQPGIPTTVPREPILIGRTLMVIPCTNGRYQVSDVGKVSAAHGSFDYLLQVTIRRTTHE